MDDALHQSIQLLESVGGHQTFRCHQELYRPKKTKTKRQESADKGQPQEAGK
jgi:hypothetical protein